MFRERALLVIYMAMKVDSESILKIESKKQQIVFLCFVILSPVTPLWTQMTLRIQYSLNYATSSEIYKSKALHGHFHLKSAIFVNSLLTY